MGQSIEIEEHRIQAFKRITADIKKRIKTVQKGRSAKPVLDKSCELSAVFIVGIFSQIASHYFIWQDKSAELMDISHKTIDFLLGVINKVFE